MTKETNMTNETLAEAIGKSEAAAKPASGAQIDLLRQPAATPTPAPAAAPKAESAASPVHPWLHQILSQRRAHNTVGDLRFRAWLTDQLKALGHKVTIMAENIVVHNQPKKSKVLFSSHVDTVHATSLCNDGTSQKLAWDPLLKHLMLDKSEQKAGACLGADDGTGVYIMLRMLKADVPGAYVFHVGEERGGIGSNALLRENEKWLKRFNIAVAFDRKGTSEIICTQGGKRCASDSSANSLAAQLNSTGLKYAISHGGTFTDTKVYAGVIPECFNLGVGYYNQHGPTEYQDVEHLEKLVEALIQTDWDQVVVLRDPKAVEVTSFPTSRRHDYWPSDDGYSGFYDDGRGNGGTYAGGRSAPPKGPSATVGSVKLPTLLDAVGGMNYDELMDFVADSPESAVRAMLLLSAKLKGAESALKVLESALDQ